MLPCSMNMNCEHSKKCGDCYSPGHVKELNGQFDELSKSYIEATEWNLATLEELKIKKGSKSSILRQKSICLRMLKVCVEICHRINWTEEERRGSLLNRVLNIIVASEQPAIGLSDAFDDYFAKI